MAWARWQEPWWLLLSAAGGLAWVLKGRPGQVCLSASALVLLLGTISGFGFHLQDHRPSLDPATAELRSEDGIKRALDRGLEEVLEAGDRAVEETVELLTRSDSIDLPKNLSRIRRRKGVTALAVYDPEGSPLAWVGVHRGPVPPEIRRGEVLYAFGGGPLFRYLYFTAPDPRGGGTVAGAVLLQTNLPAGLEETGFAARFQRRTGVPIQILPPDRVQGPTIGGLLLEGEPFLSVTRGAMDPEVLWRESVGFWVRGMALLSLLGWGLLVLGGKGIPSWRLGAGATVLGLSLLLPVDGFWPGEGLTSPAQFLLPVLGWPLGKVLGLLLAAGLLCSLLHRSSWLPSGGWGGLAGAAGVAVAFPSVDLLFRSGSSPSLFSIGIEGWLPYQGGLALALALLAFVALGGGGEVRRKKTEAGGLPLALILAALLALFLSVTGALLVRSNPGLPRWFLSLWAGPFCVAFRSLDRRLDSHKTASWAMAALLGASAALPAAWGESIQARMQVAEEELRQLGADPDPYLEFRLLRMAETADSLDGLIRFPAEFLFETWSQTGQEHDPLPMWLTLWGPGDLPREDLGMGVQGPRPPVADDYLDQVRQGTGPLVIHLGFANARYLLVVPLDGRRVLSAVVPPRGSLSLASPMGPIFAALGRQGLPYPTLVPAGPNEVAGPLGEAAWERREGGWQASWVLAYVDGDYYASQTVALPGPWHLTARGTLSLILDLIVLLLVWAAGRLLLQGRDLELRRIFRVLGSFRARVTLALFGFFCLSIAIFGTLAFRTLSGAAERTASALAARIVEDGASFYSDVQGNMELLAREVGADLLEYRNGELRDGSAEELVQLGLYEGWIPEPQYRAMQERKEIRASLRSSLGGWQYVMAFRRLQDGDILATPVPLELGATALGRQEVADLLGFAIVLGAALSLGLALLVGRTLSRPIETLQVASERVGSGNLKVRLPEDRRDEFGAVFGAFNRMVLRIRRARRALLRTTRRTQAIVEEAATGVVALDSTGRVTLVNPRAESLLNEHIPVGQTLPGREGEAGELVRWIDLYFRDGLREGNTELQMGDRRIRIRARRVSGEGRMGGAVLSLEDVTDELRSERILAWGEMAQQVAHEVKNPLTPMKLSVQHLQRAWEDRRPDFHEILAKNVEVILREIDHLAAIARSFSRFGAPQASGPLPLEAVSIQQVAEEVMNLYRGGKGALVFTCDVPDDIPAAQAREAELREVLINLLENSRAAIPFHGRVTVEAERDERGIEMRVRDDGTGIDPDFIPRIFEPHFSTRSLGTGLGLAIVRRLVESWGGSVSAESTLGEGTVVRIVIPVWSGEVSAEVPIREEEEA
jgi:two-component system nitrogen regulation sensor histidine kinase NtrY